MLRKRNGTIKVPKRSIKSVRYVFTFSFQTKGCGK